MINRQPTALERAMVGELLAVLRWIEWLPDDEIDPDTAVKIMEDIAAVVGRLDEADRAMFVQIAASLAEDADAARPGGGEGLREVLDGMGLFDAP